MTKKNFVALADMIRNHNALLDCTRNPGYSTMRYNVAQIASLAGFCQSQNPPPHGSTTFVLDTESGI